MVPAPGAPAPTVIDLVSGWLCLDLANTVEPRCGEAERDHLHRYGDLVAWARHAGALDDEAHEAELLRAATDRPPAARASFARAIALREAVYEVFAAVARSAEPAAADLEVVQRSYAAAARGATVVAAGGRFAWTWPRADLDRPWYPIARSALDLLTTGPLERLKMCPAAVGCGWLFIDVTKNNSRRWCSMETCGAEAKIKRQTARRRARRTPAHEAADSMI
jgi:predicted RNA-binding Zn ribbon-like protein